MKYPNALSGIRSIRTAEVLLIWVLVLTTLTALLALYDLALLVLLLGLAILVLVIVALVKQLIGVSRAARDLAVFASARTAIIVGLVLGVAAVILESLTVLHAVLDLASSLCSLIAEVLILKGVIALSGILGRGDMADRGQKLIRLVLIVDIASLAFELLEYLFPASPDNLAPHIAAVVLLLVLGLLRIILLLRYYADAIRMLNSSTGPAPAAGGDAGEPAPSGTWGYELDAEPPERPDR